MWFGFSKSYQYERPERATILFILPILMALTFDYYYYGTRMQPIDFVALFLMVAFTVLNAVLNIFQPVVLMRR